MLQNKLKINDDKTEFLVITSPRMEEKLSRDQKITVGATSIDKSSKARNLGVIFDNNMNMEQHITGVCKSANFHLRNIGSIRNVLSESTAAQLVHALITSRLDYCNSLLFGLPDNQIKRLQQIQNNAARMVSRVRKFDHITPTLKRLHWLPIRQRLTFKVNLLTFKSLHNQAPQYLGKLLVPSKRTIGGRNFEPDLLHVPNFKCDTFGGRSFSVIAPQEWNKLPLDIRQSKCTISFKKALKTHLFLSAYSY